MSYSSAVKDELVLKMDEARHCRIAELAAILSFFGRLSYEEQDEVTIINKEKEPLLEIVTENEAVLRKCFTLIKKTFNIEAEVYFRYKNGTEKVDDHLRIKSGLEGKRILEGTKLAVKAGTPCFLDFTSRTVLQADCCRRAFIRGAFLCVGSISDPRKGYHFELVCPTKEKAVLLQEMMASFHIFARVVARKKSFITYVKEGSQIVDLLAVMGASVSLMNLENIRIVKEMRNSVNRQVNCETANLNKTISASLNQVEDIRLIEARLGFENLSEPLAQLAVLRLSYPEASLKELGDMSKPQIGKSGVNHRLRKLSMIADELRHR